MRLRICEKLHKYVLSEREVTLMIKHHDLVEIMMICDQGEQL